VLPVVPVVPVVPVALTAAEARLLSAEFEAEGSEAEVGLTAAPPVGVTSEAALAVEPVAPVVPV
jgi:hypothetical protein